MSRTLGPYARSLASASAVIFALLSFGCGDDRNPGAENQPPTAQLTAGPVEGDTTSYQVRLFWTGNDPDGYVAAYEIAVDPPGDLSTAEWERTTEFSRLFLFSTTRPESSTAGGSAIRPTGRFHGMHAVYVRAVDDEGAFSPPAHIAVTARSVAPVTQITRPDITTASVLSVGPSIRVDWHGEDTDPTGAGPLRYEYKAVDLAQIVPPVSIVALSSPSIPQRILNSGSWIPASVDSLPMRVPLTVSAQYVFLVRAINAAGAAEPFFDWGRNAFKFQAFSSGSVPSLTLASELGTFTWDGRNHTPRESETFANVRHHFVVNATAEEYGEDIADWRWGVDLVDLESEAGWSPWITDPALPPLSFVQAGIHALYVEVRDAAGGLTRGTLILYVAEAPMDRLSLWVDDSRDKTFPSDAQQDAFWLSLFQDSGRFDMTTDFFKFEIHGAGDVYTVTPIPPTLEQLGRYKLLVWECFGDGYNGQSGLFFVSSLGRNLGLYLLAGGQLWVGGALTVSAMLGSPNGISADFWYPKTASPSSFAYHFMKLASTRILNAKGVPVADNLIGVKPFPGRSETYPQMDRDSNKINLVKGSITHCDAIFDPIDMAAAGLAGILDSLYVYEAKGATSSYQNKLTAVRWHDLDPAREHGRTQWFGFPLYYMKKDQAQVTFNRSIDWFREEVRP